MIITCILFLCSSCSSIKDDWQQAKQVDTIEKYQEFIKKHPNTDYAAAASVRIKFLQEEIKQPAQKKSKIESSTQQFKDQKLQVNTWSWRANLQSNPSGAKVYCVSDPQDRIYVGQTPIDVEILSMELRGTPGQTGTRSNTYKLPTRRIEEGFYCIFELVNGDVTKQVYAFDSSKLSDKATGGLAHDLQQGKYVLFKKGTFTITQQIPQGYKFPAPLVNELNVDFQQEIKELASQQEQIPPKRTVSERLIAETDNLVTKKKYGPVFRVSPDGKRVAYIARGTEGNESVVLDGKKQREYNEVDLPIFSLDSTRFAYVAKTSSKWTIVLDGHEQTTYDAIVCLVFSPDSRRLAYIAKQGERVCIVVDGKEGRYEPLAFDPIFSTDSQHVVYVAIEGKQSFVVLDEQEQKRYDEPAIVILPALSPDGRHLAYLVAVPGGKWFAVIGGIEGKRFDGIVAHPRFSPDSKRTAYIAIVVEEEKKKWFVVTNGGEEGPYDVIGGFTFSPDGKHLAYAAERDGIPWVVVDGKEQYRGGFIPPVFSPNSKHIAYGNGQALAVYGRAVQMQQWVVLDGLEQKHYRSVTKDSLTFSSDSQHLAYIVADETGQFVVIDGKEGKPYEEIFTMEGGSIIFDSTDRLHYVARKGNGIYLVQERIE